MIQTGCLGFPSTEAPKKKFLALGGQEMRRAMNVSDASKDGQECGKNTEVPKSGKTQI